jgi:molybdopterin/thiamine biosynthesis adenylyltransferase
MDAKERYSRQSDIVLLDRLEKQEVSVVGIGAVGRNVAIQLTAMGVPNIHLVDFDTVEESNVASQGYWEGDIGKYKVDATASSLLSINGQVNLRIDKDRYRKKIKTGSIVFSCVDKMAARKLLFESVYGKCRLFIDGRMASEVFRVLAVWDDKSAEYYRSTLFEDAEAQGTRCTSKSTIYCASGLACMEVAILSKYLRGIDLTKDFLFNVVSNETEIVE